MNRRIAVLLLMGCVLGCASAPKKEASTSVEFALPYEVVWSAVVDTIEKHFQVEREDHETGLIVTRYREGRTLVEPWGVDAQTGYQKVEETLHRVRRRVEAQLTPLEGKVTVKLTIPRERLNYEAPPTEYEAAPPATPEERKQAEIQAARTPRERWTFVGDDDLLAQKLLEEIAKRAKELSSKELPAEIKPL